MLASSWGDPVLGVDVHWELVPTPAPVPTPIPNPFTGVIFDPMGLAAGLVMGNLGMVLGATFQGPVVYWGAIPATNTGTEAKHVPGHILIPPGTAWAPVPKTPKPTIHPGETPSPPKPVVPDNDAVCITGSKTVTVGGSNAVRIGDLLLSCSEPIRLPSSVVLAVPKGAPILIGGPMSLDIMAAALASLRTRFIGDSIQALLSRMKPSRFRSVLQRTACFLTGHPVDVASGKMLTDCVDAELPGPLPLTIERCYQSNFASRSGPLGKGWSLSLDQAVWEERGKVVYLAADGREIELDTFDFPQHAMRPGDELWHPIERLTLRREERGWRITTAEGVRHDFAPIPGAPDDGRARITRIASRCGFHEITFDYDAKGRLEWVRDSAGRLIGLEHDDQRRVVALKLPLPRERGWYVHRRYEYDAGGDLVRVVDSQRNAWTFEYVTHLMVRETDRSGLSFYFEYDGLGEDAWCTRTWGDGGIYDHVINYDKKNHITYVTNSLGHTTHYHMNAAGLVVKIVDANGGETCYEYDPRTFQTLAEVDPLGHVTRYAYDAWGSRVHVQAPDGAVTTIEHHARYPDTPVRAVDPNGGEWRWEHDAAGRMIGRCNPFGHWTRFEYDGGLLRRAWTPGGATTQLDYDGAKNVSRIVEMNGSDVTYEHDELGRVIKRVTCRGGVERRRHDLEGNLLRVEEAHGVVRAFEYDPEQRLVRAQDALRDVAFAYAGRGRVRERREAGVTVRFGYDTEEQLRTVENEAGERYEFELDAAGFVTAETSFDGSTRRYTRDVAGRTTALLTASGRERTLTYDPVGRVTGVAHSDGTFERYRYRPDGALVEASNDAAEVHFERDAMGRIVRERTVRADGSSHWIKSGYGPDGHRVRVESSDGHMHHIERDASGDVTRVELEGARWRVDFERDPLGLELARHFPSGVSGAWQRDVAGRPVRRTVVARGADGASRAMSDKRYQWHGDHRIRAILDAERGETQYDHDARGRLVRARLPSGELHHRAMDAVGNVYRAPDMRDRRYGRGGRIEEADGTRYVHDDDGNLIEKTDSLGHTTRYRWNGAGMLAAVDLPDGREVRFRYDALARRLGKQVFAAPGAEWPSREIRWDWDGHNPLTELDSEEGKSTWVFEPETFNPLLKLARGRIWGVLTDQIGTPTELVSVDGALDWVAESDLHDVRPRHEATRCPFRWPGQQSDEETGLSYNRYRYYSGELGRYLSSDPIGLSGGIALQAYVSDVLTSFDALGLIERLFRYVSEAEARQSAGNWGGDNNLHPRPHGETLSRGPKWVTEGGAEPRLGSSRPDTRLDIEVEDGTTQWLRENGIDFDRVSGESAAPNRVLTKANEPGSHGVGRDLLDQFNERIRRITATREGGRGGRRKKRRGGCGRR